MGRRRLDFRDFDAVARDMEQLCANGYRQVGNWDLGQIADHLAGAMNGSVSGFPIKAPWIFRRLLGRRFFKKILASRRLRSGVKIPERLIPPKGGDPSAAIARFRAAVTNFERHEGTFQEHPFLGRFDGSDWREFHLIHAGHHLSFLVPEGS